MIPDLILNWGPASTLFQFVVVCGEVVRATFCGVFVNLQVIYLFPGYCVVEVGSGGALRVVLYILPTDQRMFFDWF